MDRHNVTLVDREHSRREAEHPWRSWYKSPIWKTIKRHRLVEDPIVDNVLAKGKWCLQATSRTLNTIRVSGRSSSNTITPRVFVISI